MKADTILAARRDAAENFDSRILSGNVWNLCDDHFVEVVNWLWGRLPFEAIEMLCEKELGLPSGKKPSKSALQRFWRDSGFFRLLQRHNRFASRDGAAEIAGELRKSPSEYEEANIERIQQTAFELMESGAPAEEVKPFVAAVVRLNNLKLQKEKWEGQMKDKISAGIDELAKTLPPELVATIRETIAAKMEARA